MEKQIPVVLRNNNDTNNNLMSAIEKWKDKRYTIEIGPYNQGEHVAIPFQQYAEYLQLLWQQQEQHELLYLAQNDIPYTLLDDDIVIPIVCTKPLLKGQHGGKLCNTNIWIGPAGTLSPLHYDPLDNFLI